MSTKNAILTIRHSALTIFLGAVACQPSPPSGLLPCPPDPHLATYAYPALVVKVPAIGGLLDVAVVDADPAHVDIDSARTVRVLPALPPASTAWIFPAGTAIDMATIGSSEIGGLVHVASANPGAPRPALVVGTYQDAARDYATVDQDPAHVNGDGDRLLTTFHDAPRYSEVIPLPDDGSELPDTSIRVGSVVYAYSRDGGRNFTAYFAWAR